MNSTLELVKEDLKRHCVDVILPEKKERSFYLVEVSALSRKLTDFLETYSDQKLTELHRKLAKKIFGEKKSVNIYGVLLDEDLKMVFAFNREFADYDGKERKIIYKGVDEILLGLVAETVSLEPAPDLQNPFPKKPGSSGGMLIRYSLTEKSGS